MKNLSTKWQKLIAYLTAFIGIVPFLIGGGYIFLKSENDDAKKSVKTAFLLTVLFTVIEAIANIIYYFAQGGCTIVLAIILTLKFVAFATIFCLDAFKIVKFDCLATIFGDTDKEEVASEPEKKEEVASEPAPAVEETAKAEVVKPAPAKTTTAKPATKATTAKPATKATTAKATATKPATKKTGSNAKK